MNKLKTLKTITGSIATSATAMLFSTSVLAHTGHSHAQHDTLSGILHTLMTHPVLFGVLGIVICTAAYIRNH